MRALLGALVGGDVVSDMVAAGADKGRGWRGGGHDGMVGMWRDCGCGDGILGGVE